MVNLNLVVMGHVGFENIYTNTDIITYCGGAGYYTSVASSLFSKKVGLVSRIGADFDIKKLKNLGIDLEGVKMINDGLSTQFKLKYNKENFELRDFKCDLNVGEGIKSKDIPEEYFFTKYFHIATAPPRQQINWINHIRRKKSNAIISIDTIDNYIKTCKRSVINALSLADIIFVNRKEFESLTELKNHKNIIIKKGPEGADYLTNGKVLYSVKPPHATLIDPTGAGDILAGVYLSVINVTNDYKKSLEIAVKIASESIEQYGVDFLLKRCKMH